jgi:hypothetical protein
MNFRGGARYRYPQAWIDYVISKDPALKNVRLSYTPRFSSRLKIFGRATLPDKGVAGNTLIGRRSLASRAELIDTIIHEELHHRIWKRAARGRKKDIDEM